MIWGHFFSTWKNCHFAVVDVGSELSQGHCVCCKDYPQLLIIQFESFLLRMGTFSAQQYFSSRLHTQWTCIQFGVCNQFFFRSSVLVLHFRSLNQEAKSSFRASTEYKSGPQIQRGASSGLFGISHHQTLQRYRNTLP